MSEAMKSVEKHAMSHFILIVMLAAAFSFLSIPAKAALPAAVDGQPLPSLAPMLERVMPAVVNISTTSRPKQQRPNHPLLSDPFFQRFFGLPPQREQKPSRSLGSGVIIDAKKGYIVTNHHVIDGADVITIALTDRRRLRAKLIGSDPEADVAVLQVPAEGLTAVKLFNSEKLRVGDFVVAIGNPFGLGQTATSGMVSALGRTGLGIEGYEDFIQTDASINPGNSGGALVNLKGELVGINTAILAPGEGGGNVGIGFAIPTNMAMSIIDQLVEHGEIRRGFLGVQVQDLNPQLAEAFDLQRGTGAVITEISAGSPAERAGLQPGHIVIAVDGQPVESAADMRNIVGLVRAGSTIRIDVIDRGQNKRFDITIVDPQLTQMDGARIHPALSGTVLSPVQAGHPLYGDVNGAQIMQVHRRSPAAQTGLQVGDVMVSVNKRPISNPEMLAQALNNRPRSIVRVLRGRQSFDLRLR